MVSLKNGVLKVTSDSEGIAKLIYDVCFVINMLVDFSFYRVKFIAPATALLLLAASLFIWTGRRNSKVIIPYNTVWYLAVTIYAGLSALWASYIVSDFIPELLRMFVILAITTSVAIYVDTSEDLERLMSLFVFSVLIITVLEFTSVPPSEWFNGEMGSHFSGINPNEISFWIACAEMISFYKFYLKKKKIYIVWAFIFLVFVLLSSSRKAAAEALIAPLAIILLSTFKKNYFLKVILMLVIISFIIYFVMTNEYVYHAVGRRFMSMREYFLTGTRRSDNSMYLRYYFIDVAKKLFYESPLLGKGMGNFAKNLEFLSGIDTYSHNNHWQILSEFGIVGFIIYYSFYVFCFVKLFRAVFIKKSRMCILYLSLIVIIFVFEIGMVTYNFKTTQLILAMVYTSTYVGEDDGRLYRYISDNKNKLEE